MVEARAVWRETPRETLCVRHRHTLRKRERREVAGSRVGRHGPIGARRCRRVRDGQNGANKGGRGEESGKDGGKLEGAHGGLACLVLKGAEGGRAVCRWDAGMSVGVRRDAGLWGKETKDCRRRAGVYISKRRTLRLTVSRRLQSTLQSAAFVSAACDSRRSLFSQDSNEARELQVS